jgi:predicted ATPase/class 3 adenylate cyclase
MDPLPTGTVTFLFTDIEGSTRLLASRPDDYPDILEAHNRLLRQAIDANGGVEVSTEGDSFFVAFPTAPQGVAAAVAAQQALLAYPWPRDEPVRVRMGIHSGEVSLGGDDYIGLEVHRAARIASAGHGGQVLVSEATRALARDHLPSQTSFRDLGDHRLKDLSRREHLYQLDIGGIDGEFPSLHTLEAVANNLPIQLTSFVGREQELADLSQLVADNRLVTLRGPGGVGKTRLATQAAAQLVEEFPDGIWMVDLTATEDPELVPTLLAESLGLRDIGALSGRPLSEELADYVGDKNTLILFDNCEHVLDASSELITTLIRTSGQIHVIATSRDALGVPGAQYNVPTLEQEASGAGDSDAVRLFADRATQANPDFSMDGTDVEPVAEIARRLDGLPLAIELAAARVNVLTPQQILDRLEDRFVLLKAKTGAPERHETLRATMDWSYDLLGDVERDAMQRLSVFSGWSLEAAESVLGDNVDAVDVLSSLVDRSLVEASVKGGHSRYRLLETVRQYAYDKLVGNGEEQAAHAAHADYFLGLTEAGDQGVRGPEQAEWVQRLKADHDNVRSAIAWAIETGESDLALRLVAAMSWYWLIDGYWQGPLQLFRRVYEEGVDADPLLRARAVYKAGGIALIWGWFGDMAPLLEEAYDTLLEVGDERDIAYATHFLGGIQASRGDPDAGELLEESIRRFAELGDEWGQAFAERWMGSVVELSGDAARTIDHQRASLAAFIRLGDRWSAAWISFVLGFNLVPLGEFDEAQRVLEQSLELVAGIEDRLILPHAKRGLAAVAGRTGRPQLARSILEEALPLYRRIGDESCISVCHLQLGEIETDAGDYAAARAHLARSLQGFMRLGNQLDLGPLLRRTSELAAAASEHERAATLAGAAEASRTLAGGMMSAHDRARFEEAQSSTEAALGPAEYRRLVDAGEAMSRDQATEYADEGLTN